MFGAYIATCYVVTDIANYVIAGQEFIDHVQTIYNNYIAIATCNLFFIFILPILCMCRPHIEYKRT